MLWDLEDFEDQIYENAMRVFSLDTHTCNYFVTIKTPMTYQFAFKYIDIGISLNQTASPLFFEAPQLALQATK